MFWTLALLCCAALVYFRRARRRSRIPSVPGIPLLQLKSSSRFVEQAELWAVEHGKTGLFTFSLLGRRHVVCCDYESIMQVMALRPHRVTRAHSVNAAVRSAGDGLFSGDCEIKYKYAPASPDDPCNISGLPDWA